MSTPIVVMGVSGSGKSTVGALMARQLGLPFVDGDDLHSSHNKEKMAARIPLDDADRAPWLEAVGAVLAQGPVIVACSALRRRYRDKLRSVAPSLRLVYLQGSRAILTNRLAGRTHAFMPSELLDSQLATLEAPEPDEGALTLDISTPPAELTAIAVSWYRKPLTTSDCW
ncbi:MAG TPA: gluconokinase [Steroidobacteraceae bacterium]|nr:gluconokinase [Steroidobacteraceae bacterium]